MISGIREYIDDRVKEIDSDFSEWEDGFNMENIPSTLMDKSFFVEYGISSVADDKTLIIDTIEVTLRLFFKGFRNVKDALDNSMDLADNIRINILGKGNIANSDYLTAQNTGMVASQINESNDNSLVVEMTFNFEQPKAIC